MRVTFKGGRKGRGGRGAEPVVGRTLLVNPLCITPNDKRHQSG
jgi:hypothetical protein